MVSNSSRIAEHIMFARSMKILMMCVMLLAFIIWWKLIGDNGKVIQESALMGVVSEKRKSSYLINLDDGRKLRVPGRGLLKEGARVRLTQRTFEKGNPEILLSFEQEALGDD